MKRLLVLAFLLGATVSCAESVDDGDTNGGSGGSGGIDVGPAPGPSSAACLAAAEEHSSVGCEYWAVDMESIESAAGGCFVAFVANTADDSAHIQISFLDQAADLSAHAKIPRGSGTSLVYDDYDPSEGLRPGQVAIVFLAGLADTAPPSGNPFETLACPVPPIRSTLAQLIGTGVGTAFHIQSDRPVVAYQMLPYGGGTAAITGASLLIPTSAWDKNYVAVDAWGAPQTSSLNIVASEDDTTVTFLPKVPILGGGEIPATPAGSPLSVKLDRGRHLQLTQLDELSGSPIEADKPIGLFGGAPCIDLPSSVMACDHAEQSIPPIHAMGSEYVGVTYRRRTSMAEDPPWRVIGAVDGTTLEFDPPVVGAPSTLNLGDVIEFHAGETPFSVKSQDEAHPFLLFGYMTGGAGLIVQEGVGDPDFVRAVPPAQCLAKYVFFTDPTYPETNLVVTRRAGDPAPDLDCAGNLGGWQPLGSGEYEYTRIDLVRRNFEPQGGCDNGPHVMTSDEPFGLTVWGWGNLDTNPYTYYVSYAYPAGENLAPLNTVLIPASNSPK
jgi:IgGFc binding protein